MPIPAAAALAPLIWKGLVGASIVGTGAMGVGSGYGMVQDVKKTRLQELLSQGKGDDGTYGLNFTDYLPGIGVDQSQLTDSKQSKFNKKQIGAESNIFSLLPGLKVEAGDTDVDAFLLKHDKAYKTAERDKLIADNTAIGDAVFGGKQASYNREQQQELQRFKFAQLQSGETQANNRLSAQLAASAEQYKHGLSIEGIRNAHALAVQDKRDALQTSLANLSADTNIQLGLMQRNESKDQRAFDRETRMMDRRDRNIAKSMEGLSALAGLFAFNS